MNRLLCGMLAVLTIHCAFAERLQGTVVSIADGDTITVLDAARRQHKVRLAGIDAPERKQPFGQRSKSLLGAMVFQREVSLDCRKRDRYRRQLCVVFLDGQDANLAQVESGMAWWYRRYASDQTMQERQAYESAEIAARRSRVGLWMEPNPIPPWEWRHKR